MLDGLCCVLASVLLFNEGRPTFLFGSLGFLELGRFFAVVPPNCFAAAFEGAEAFSFVATDGFGFGTLRWGDTEGTTDSNKGSCFPLFDLF